MYRVASGMQLWITTKCRGTVSISTDLVGILGIPEFSWFGLGSLNATYLVDITAKKAGIKYVLVVEHSEYKIIGKNSQYELISWFPYM